MPHLSPSGPRPTLVTELTRAVDRVIEAAARVRWPLLLLLAGGLTAAGLSGGLCDGDGQMFANAGWELVSGHWAAVYQGAGNQAGPLELVWNWLATAGGTNCQDVGRELPGAMLVAALVVVAVTLMARRALADVPASRRSRLELGVGLLAVAMIAPWAARWGHPADVAIPLAWLAAGRCARRGRWLAAAVLLGAAAGWETWAVLGAPVLLLGRWRDAGRAAPVAAAVAACWYAPFAATGSFAMLAMRWTVWHGSLVGTLTGWHQLPWAGRVAQTLLVAVAGAIVARRARASRHGVWLAPLTVALARLVTDPGLWPYYWSIPAIPALAGMVALLGRRTRASGELVLLAACATVLVPHPDLPWAYLQLGAALALVAMALRRRPQPADEQSAGTPGRTPDSGASPTAETSR